MSSGSPNESTASRLQRIGRRSDTNDRQDIDLDFVEDNDDIVEQENIAVGGAAAAAAGAGVDLEPSEVNQELLEANCTDLEPDMSDLDSSRNCSNVSAPWSVSQQGEPSNFSVSNIYVHSVLFDKKSGANIQELFGIIFDLM